MLLLDERIKADGTHVRTWAAWLDGEVGGDPGRDTGRDDPQLQPRLQIRDDDGATGALPLVAVDRVMTRYGRPLDRDVVLEGESIRCGRYRLRRLRFHAVVDAEARDYLVWEAPDAEPLACVAAMATAALRHLAARLAAVRQESEA